MDHNNIVYENFTTEIVPHWCLLLKYCGQNIDYIKGHDNDVEDSLIRLLLINSGVKDINITS